MERVRIELREVRLYGRHGVGEAERKVGGRFTVGIVAEVGVERRALEGDELEGTVDYGAMYEVVKEEFAEPSRLLENVAWRIGRRLLARFRAIERVDVEVEKIAPPIGADCRSAAVKVSCTRSEE